MAFKPFAVSWASEFSASCCTFSLNRQSRARNFHTCRRQNAIVAISTRGSGATNACTQGARFVRVNRHARAGDIHQKQEAEDGEPGVLRGAAATRPTASVAATDTSPMAESVTCDSSRFDAPWAPFPPGGLWWIQSWQTFLLRGPAASAQGRLIETRRLHLQARGQLVDVLFFPFRNSRQFSAPRGSGGDLHKLGRLPCPARANCMSSSLPSSKPAAVVSSCHWC